MINDEIKFCTSMFSRMLALNDYSAFNLISLDKCFDKVTLLFNELSVNLVINNLYYCEINLNVS